MKFLLASVVAAFACTAARAGDAPRRIDRHALVTRHNVVITAPDAQCPLQVGNGEFAFSTDVTGLQTFYGNTMSHWGWHTSPLPPGQRPEDFKLTEYDFHGRKVCYATSKDQGDLYKWLRENPHRLNLGKLSINLLKADGHPAASGDLRGIRHELDLWRGVVAARYELDGAPVQVETCCHPTQDLIAVRIVSPLIAARRLGVVIAFPYGSPGVAGADWTKPEAHRTTLTRPTPTQANFARQLDADAYAVRLGWSSPAALTQRQAHEFSLDPDARAASLEFVCAFDAGPGNAELPSVAQTFAASEAHWSEFWNSGGAVDLSLSKDPRWKELERRIVLSQYLEAIQAAGSLPPQESCLVNNGWNGKFHLEMHWWHGVHFALWNRWAMFDRSLGWYRRVLPAAQALARQQGFRGARWPKMVGPEGRDSPSGVGPLILWQQPHPIYYAELDYRLHPTAQTLETWRDVVFQTADFLASYASFDKAAGVYTLDPPMKTVPENNNPLTTRNPVFELSYWRFGLRVAQQWRLRLGLARDAGWDDVLHKLAPLPQRDGLYIMQDGAANTYTKMNWEHPSLIGVLGMLPGDGVDPAVFLPTLRKVAATWQWDRCWGWDFPMTAMAAARSGQPNIAVDMLLHSSRKNAYSANGFASGGPYPYFPSNGGLLAAVAMMCAGFGDVPPPSNETHVTAPGFPGDGSWTVRWENLLPAP